MNFYDAGFEWPEMMRGIVKRSFTHLDNTAYQFFLPREGFTHLVHEDGLGGEICVASWRPEVLLAEINKRAFRAFVFERPRVDTYGFYWTRFRAM